MKKWRRVVKGLNIPLFWALAAMAFSGCAASSTLQMKALPQGQDCAQASRLLSLTPPQGMKEITQLALRQNPKLVAKRLDLEQLRSLDRALDHAGGSMDVLSGQPSFGFSNLVGLLKAIYYQANPEADSERQKLLAQLKTLEAQVTRSVAQEFENLQAATAQLDGLQREKNRLSAKAAAVRLIAQAVESADTQEDLARQEQRVVQIQDRIAAQEARVQKARSNLLSLTGCLLPTQEGAP